MSITTDVYNKKANELKTEQYNIKVRLDKVGKANDEFSITVNYLLDISSRAFELFKSSEIDVKRKIINFVFSNLVIDGKNLEFSIRKPFDKFVNLSKGSNWLRQQDSNLRQSG